MKLVPEQVIALRKGIIDKRRVFEGYMDYFEENRYTTSDDISRLRIGDSVTENSYHMDRTAYRKYEETLSDSEIVDVPNFEMIDIGTRFNVLYDGDDEEITLKLVESAEFISALSGFVSIASPIGAAVRFAKEGQHFNIKVNGRNIGFTITSIDKDINNYLRPINSVKKSDRTCGVMQKEIRSAVDSGDLEKQAEYKAITPSQVALLNSERDRLRHSRDKSNATLSRIGKISKMLETRRVVSSHNTDTIGIGSTFSVKLVSKNDELTFEDVELINCAVSDEYSFEYVERIGAIGCACYGLKDGDTFKVRLGNTYYTGTVYNINNHYAVGIERGHRK